MSSVEHKLEKPLAIDFPSPPTARVRSAEIPRFGSLHGSFWPRCRGTRDARETRREDAREGFFSAEGRLMSYMQRAALFGQPSLDFPPKPPATTLISIACVIPPSGSQAVIKGNGCLFTALLFRGTATIFLFTLFHFHIFSRIYSTRPRRNKRG